MCGAGRNAEITFCVFCSYVLVGTAIEMVTHILLVAPSFPYPVFAHRHSGGDLSGRRV